MIDIFELMDKKFGLKSKTKNLAKYIYEERIFPWGYNKITFYELFSGIFHIWKYNNCYMDLNSMLKDLEIIEFEDSNMFGKNGPDFKLNTNIDCCVFLQFLINALKFAKKCYKGYNYNIQFDTIEVKINYIMDKMNYQIIYSDGYYKIVDSSPIVRKVAECSDEETAYKLLSYNEVDNVNDIEHKRQILNYLANITEPITKGYDKKSGDKYELYNNLDFALNNLNIRHNNKQGKNENDFIKNINNSDLMDCYDDIFNLIVCVLALNNCEQSYINIAKIREKL